MYETLDIPTSSSRPWVYANFVMTLDGKTAVGSLQKSYWPIGSTVDFEAMRHLRMQADLLVHGRKTACFYPTLHRLRVPSFQEARRAHGRDPHLAYAVVSEQAHDELIPFVATQAGIPTYLIATETSSVSAALERCTTVARIGQTRLDVRCFLDWCWERGYKRVLLEGGAQLFQAFLEAGCVDDLFLTVTPTFIGGVPGQTKSLLEHGLFPPEQLPRGRLISCQSVDGEVFLRYRFSDLV